MIHTLCRCLIRVPLPRVRENCSGWQVSTREFLNYAFIGTVETPRGVWGDLPVGVGSKRGNAYRPTMHFLLISLRVSDFLTIHAAWSPSASGGCQFRRNTWFILILPMDRVSRNLHYPLPHFQIWYDIHFQDDWSSQYSGRQWQCVSLLD